MNNTIIKSQGSQVRYVYRKCNKCGQIICNTEFYGSVMVADKCPKCGVNFVDDNTHIGNEIVRHALKDTIKEKLLN